jgi:hypothetical protein
MTMISRFFARLAAAFKKSQTRVWKRLARGGLSNIE